MDARKIRLARAILQEGRILIAATKRTVPRSFELLLRLLVTTFKGDPTFSSVAKALTPKAYTRLDTDTKRNVANLWRSIETFAAQESGKMYGKPDERMSKLTITALRSLASHHESKEEERVDEADVSSMCSAFERALPTLVKQTYDSLKREAPKFTGNAKTSAPKTFAQFRKSLAKVLKPFDAGFAGSIGDVDYEGSVASKLFNGFWEDFAAVVTKGKLRGVGAMDAFLEQIEDSLNDSLVNALQEYRNPNNYAPNGMPSAHLRPGQISMVVHNFERMYGKRGK